MAELKSELTKKAPHLCDCKEECPAHPQNRFLHIADRCYHVDGTSHKIYSKRN